MKLIFTALALLLFVSYVPTSSGGQLLDFYHLRYPDDTTSDRDILFRYVHEQGEDWLKQKYPADYYAFRLELAILAGIPNGREIQDAILDKIWWVSIIGACLAGLLVASYCRAITNWIAGFRPSFGLAFAASALSRIGAVLFACWICYHLAESEYPLDMSEYVLLRGKLAFAGGVTGFLAGWVVLFAVFNHSLLGGGWTIWKNKQQVSIWQALKITLTEHLIFVPASIGILLLLFEDGYRAWGLLAIAPLAVATWWIFIPSGKLSEAKEAFSGKISEAKKDFSGKNLTASQRNEDLQFYETVRLEVDKGDIDETLMFKAKTFCDGDKDRAIALYTKWRVEQLSTEAIHEKPNVSAIVEMAIRKSLKKPGGEFPKVGLEKITGLNLELFQLTEVPKRLEKLTQLETLKIYGNQLTDVKGLEKLTQLRILWIQDNKLTDVKGLETLTQLKELNLSTNKLTDVKGLETLTQLKILRLFDNPDLTKAQIDRLQKALPKCRIRSNPKK